MKKSFILWMGVVLMMVIGMSSCSSEEDNGYDKDLVRKWATTEPAFTYNDFEVVTSDLEETTN